MKLKFGDRIFIFGKIIRLEKNGRYFWEIYTHKSPVEGIFLKRINLYNGRFETTDAPDYESYFEFEEAQPGAWVCRKGFKPEKIFLYQCIKDEK